jgi:hypothetical protein
VLEFKQRQHFLYLIRDVLEETKEGGNSFVSLHHEVLELGCILLTGRLVRSLDVGPKLVDDLANSEVKTKWRCVRIESTHLHEVVSLSFSPPLPPFPPPLTFSASAFFTLSNPFPTNSMSSPTE